MRDDLKNLDLSGLSAADVARKSAQQTRQPELGQGQPEIRAREGELMQHFSKAAFTTVLNSAQGLLKFQKFMESERSCENVKFWTRVNQLRDYKNKLMRLIDDVHNEFIALGSANEININTKQRAQATMEYEALRAALGVEYLKSTQDSVYDLMYQDSFGRFVKKELEKTTQKVLNSTNMSQDISGICTSFCLSDCSLPDNPVVLCSDGFTSTTGYAFDEVIPLNCRFLQGPGTDKMAIKRIREAIINQTSASELLLNYKKDGTPFWNLLYIAPLRNEDGTVRYFVGTQLNVTSLFDQTDSSSFAANQRTPSTEKEDCAVSRVPTVSSDHSRKWSATSQRISESARGRSNSKTQNIEVTLPRRSSIIKEESQPPIQRRISVKTADPAAVPVPQLRASVVGSRTSRPSSYAAPSIHDDQKLDFSSPIFSPRHSLIVKEARSGNVTPPPPPAVQQESKRNSVVQETNGTDSLSPLKREDTKSRRMAAFLTKITDLVNRSSEKSSNSIGQSKSSEFTRKQLDSPCPSGETATGSLLQMPLSELTLTKDTFNTTKEHLEGLCDMFSRVHLFFLFKCMILERQTGVIIYVSNALSRMLKTSSSTVPSLKSRNLITEVIHARYRKEVEEAYLNGNWFGGIIKLNQDFVGADVSVRLYLCALKDIKGALAGYIGVMTF